MSNTLFRYRFTDRIPASQVEGTLVLAWLATEGLYGEARVRLEATHFWDRRRGVCVIRARGAAGRAANRIFVALIGREFGPDAFQVEHVPIRSDSSPSDRKFRPATAAVA